MPLTLNPLTPLQWAAIRAELAATFADGPRLWMKSPLGKLDCITQEQYAAFRVMFECGELLGGTVFGAESLGERREFRVGSRKQQSTKREANK